MSGLNKVILIGNLGKDPEIRHIDNNVAVAKFSLATTETYKNKEGQRQDQTEWHNVVAWRGLADVAERFLKKGSQVYIEGKIKTRSWDDKDGNKKYMTEIVADNLIMLGRKSDDNASGSYQSSSSQGSKENSMVTSPDDSFEDDLPF